MMFHRHHSQHFDRHGARQSKPPAAKQTTSLTQLTSSQGAMIEDRFSRFRFYTWEGIKLTGLTVVLAVMWRFAPFWNKNKPIEHNPSSATPAGEIIPVSNPSPTPASPPKKETAPAKSEEESPRRIRSSDPNEKMMAWQSRTQNSAAKTSGRE